MILMFQKLTRTSLIAIALTGLLGGCASSDFSANSGSQSEQRAASLAQQGRHDESAAIYIGMASATSGAQRDRLTLLAVEQWLDAGDGTRARSAMRDVARPATGELYWLWTTNNAAIDLLAGRPDPALSTLDPLSAQPLPLKPRLRVEALRADAWFQKDEPMRAVQLYTQREQWLDDDAGILQNRQRLWAGLLVSDVRSLRTASDLASDATIQGWLSLGALATSTGQQGIGWSNGVVRWQESNALHPGMSIVSDLIIPTHGMQEFPRQVALLLPLSGQNGTAGSAVQNGFFGAYFSATTELGSAQQIRIYDVVAAGGARAAYAQAVADGADFVVGPLLRGSVNDIAAETLLPVPLLTLNNLQDNVLAPPGMYQFALSPEDEAISAAQRVIADGKTLAVALIPDNDWGRRLLTSFATEFESRGGTLLEFRNYQPADQDFSFEIENLMGLAQSAQRYQRLRANIGGPLQFDPRRREDAEVIFLAATAPVGRLLKSQLKFHYSGELPVYSTSRINLMDGRSDSDLNGIMFADTPWVIAPQPWIAELPDLYSEFWPGERRLGRLHAMGYDAYQLVSELYVAGTGTMTEINGSTGRLSLDQNGQVHRELAWAVFERGQAVALPDPILPEEEYGIDEFSHDGQTDQPATSASPIQEL
jgi:outer membrane PBP1 activator LpoA protein